MSKSTDLMIELRSKSVEELLQMNEDRRAELFALRFQAAVGSLEQTHKIRENRKIIARIQMLLAEHKANGIEVNKKIIVNYSKAVNEAETAGKEVRAKQRKMIEELQKQQMGNSPEEISEDLIEKAMASAMEEPVKVEVEQPKAEVQKASAVKKAVIEKLEKEPKVVEKQIEELKPIEKTAKATGKGKTKDLEVTPIKSGTAAVGTGKGKNSTKDVKVPKIKAETLHNSNVEGINLNLKGKPEDSKTYTFGSNVPDAKKQLEEATKKQLEKKAADKTNNKTNKGAK